MTSDAVLNSGGEAQATQATPEAPVTPETPDWRSGLSDEYKGKYEEMKDVNSLMKGYDSLVKKMGQNPLVRPGDDASDDDKAAFRKTLAQELGATGNKEDYSFSSDELPEYLKGGFSEDALSGYVDYAVENDMTPQQFQGLLGLYAENSAKEMDSYRENTQTVLKEKYGEDYDKNIKGATEFANQFAPELLNDPYAGNNPVVIDLLHKLNVNFGDRLGEGDVEGFAGKGAGSIEGLEAKKQELLKKSVDANISIDDRRKATQELSDVYKRLEANKG